MSPDFRISPDFAISKGSFSITSFSRNEALEEAITVSVTAKLAVFDEWVEVGGS